MKLKIGDLVRFVDEAIEGHITSFQNGDIIGVTDSSGFEIPVPINKVTLVHGHMHRADDEVESLTSPRGPFVDNGISLAVTGEQKDGLARFSIVNESSYQLLISIAEKSGNKAKGISTISVLPKSHDEFYTANFSAAGKWPLFIIQILRYTTESYTPTPSLSQEIRVSAFDLNNPKKHSEVLERKAWLFQLDKEEQDIGLDKLKNFGKR